MHGTSSSSTYCVRASWQKILRINAQIASLQTIYCKHGKLLMGILLQLGMVSELHTGGKDS